MDRITVHPDPCGGGPCICGSRSRTSDVLTLSSVYLTVMQVFVESPDRTREDLTACLRFASRKLGHPVVAAYAVQL